MEQHFGTSDEASESEFMDKSLSMWCGWTDPCGDDLPYDPIPLDLHTAASLGDYDCVKNHLANPDNDLNRTNKGGWSALMYASYIGHDTIVNLLLEAGANANIRSESGKTALMMAASCGNESVAYFLLQQGADLEAVNKKGWTALFFATYTGHQTLVKFLLENNANINKGENQLGITPFMMAAAEGHEMIVKSFLEQGVDINVQNRRGDTARTLALINGHMKVVALIDNRSMAPTTLRSSADLDLSSSDENFVPPSRHPPHHHNRSGRSKVKGLSVQDGPEAFAKLLGEKKNDFGSLSSSKNAEIEKDETNPFCISDAVTIRSSAGSSCSSSGGSGLAGALGLSREGSLSSNDGEPYPPASTIFNNPNSSFSAALEDFASHLGRGQRSHSDPVNALNVFQYASRPVISQYDPAGQKSLDSSQPAKSVTFNLKHQEVPSSVDTSNHGNKDKADDLKLVGGNSSHHEPSIGYTPSINPINVNQQHPFRDLAQVLDSLNLGKYNAVFADQDVDLRVFLTLTDNDLKEVGIKLMGPRRKMTNAIARWHSQARMFTSNLEQVYADRMETAMQEIALQYQEACMKKEELEAELLQERELRSVVEGCLMEDRKTYQHMFKLITDTRKLCHKMREMYDNVRTFQAELLHRIEISGLGNPLIPTPEELAQNLQIGLMLDSQFPLIDGSPSGAPDSHGHGGSESEVSLHRPSGQGIHSQAMVPVDHREGTINQQALLHHNGGNTMNDYNRRSSLDHMTMQELMSHLGQMSHQMARVVATATNNIDQLLDGQTSSFSPNSSGNSLP